MLQNLDILFPYFECLDIETIQMGESPFSLLQNPEVQKPEYHCIMNEGCPLPKMCLSLLQSQEGVAEQQVRQEMLLLLLEVVVGDIVGSGLVVNL